MDDLSGGWLALVVSVQVIVFLSLVYFGFRLVKVIKSQNNNLFLAPEITAKLKRLFARSPKS